MTAKEAYMDGLAKLGTNDLDGAIASFQKSIDRDDVFFLGYLGWSQALDRQGKVDAAIAQVEKAIELAPDEPLVHTSLSRLYQQKGMIAEAEREMALSQKLSASV